MALLQHVFNTITVVDELFLILLIDELFFILNANFQRSCDKVHGACTKKPGNPLDSEILSNLRFGSLEIRDIEVIVAGT